MSEKYNRYKKIKMKDKPDTSKKPILIFAFFLNIMIMIVMGVVIWNENLFVADRVVDFCKFVFIVNIFICVVYIVKFLLFVIKIILEGGGISWNKITPKSFTKLRTGSRPAVRENEMKTNVFLDFIKDYGVKILLTFVSIFLAIFIFTVIWNRIN